MSRCAFCIVAVLALSDAAAQSATAHLAPGQLRVAESALHRAEAALARGDYGLAGRMAAVAQTDARLAWAMTDSEHLRQEAEDVNEEAAFLGSQLAAGRAQAAGAR